MKVKELIEILKKENKQLAVVYKDDDNDFEVSEVETFMYARERAQVGFGEEYTEKVIYIS